MVEITVPKISDISNYIHFNDLGIDPEYIEDHSYDPTYYNNEHLPVQQLVTKVYSKTAHATLKKETELALKQYKEWIESAPWFITIKQK